MFVDEFRQQYVGEDTPELRAFVLSSTTKSITSIKAQFLHSVTKIRITISPDDVFKQMPDYIVLLPDNARIWMFSLGETFVCALTPEMQTDITLNNFVMPEKSRSTHKVEQVAALNVVRSTAIQAHERSYLNNKAIQQQVQTSLASSGVYSGLSVNDTFFPSTTSNTFDTYNKDPSYSTMTDDKINNLSHYGIPESPPLPPPTHPFGQQQQFHSMNNY